MLKAIVFLYLLGVFSCEGHVTFTNLKCAFVSKAVGEFTQCHIRAVNRTHKYISIYEKIHLKPLDNITLNMKFLRYDHGYKPFIIDVTIDGCLFLKNQRHPIFNIVYRMIKDNSNINHTCPFYHDIIVDKLWTGDLDRHFSNFFPIPSGDYAIFTKWYTSKKPLADLNIYLKVDNPK